MSHFLEHLPFKGTRSWPTALAISEAVEGVGGMMNAATDREMTSFWCKVASVYADRALPVIIDLVRHPLLDPTEMEKEREVILDELRMTNDYPAEVCALLDRPCHLARAGHGTGRWRRTADGERYRVGGRTPVYGTAVSTQQHGHQYCRRAGS